MLKETGDAWVADDVPRLAASLAFYTVLSLIPFLIVVSRIAATAFGEKAARGELIWQLRNFTGSAGAQAIQDLIQAAGKSSTAATVVGWFTLLFGASAVIMELRDALNTIWRVPPVATHSSAANFVRLVRERFYLFGLIFGVGILMLISLALNSLVSAISAMFGPLLPVAHQVMHAIVLVVSFAVITLVFAIVYKVVPDVRLTWRDVIVGACVTSLLFAIGRQLIGMYLGTVNYESSYGAAGSLLIVLVWVYYSAQLFFFGAEFTKVYADKRQSRPAAPDEVASLNRL